MNKNECYGIRPSPVSCCWQCKNYDIKNLYCNDLNKQVSPFSLCPEIIDIETKELRERKRFFCDNLFCAVSFNKNKENINYTEKGEYYSLYYEFDKDIPKILQMNILNSISNIITETVDTVEWLDNTVLKVRFEIHGFYPALFYIKLLINALINECIDTFVEM